MSTRKFWDYENKKKLFETYLLQETMTLTADIHHISASRCAQLLAQFVAELALSWVQSAYRMKVSESRDVRIVNCFEILQGHKKDWLQNGEFLLSAIRKIEISADTTGRPLLIETHAKGRAVAYVNQPRAH